MVEAVIRLTHKQCRMIRVGDVLRAPGRTLRPVLKVTPHTPKRISFVLRKVVQRHSNPLTVYTSSDFITAGYRMTGLRVRLRKTP